MEDAVLFMVHYLQVTFVSCMLPIRLMFCLSCQRFNLAIQNDMEIGQFYSERQTALQTPPLSSVLPQLGNVTSAPGDLE